MESKKRGMLGLYTLIFTILNIAFFVIMVMFVKDAGFRIFVYEEAYAKQIALLIDNSRPDMVVLIDVEKGLIRALENGVDRNEIFKLDKENNRVEVGLGKGASYSYQYFSDYDVDLKLNGEWLSIVVKDKSVEVADVAEGIGGEEEVGVV